MKVQQQPTTKLMPCKLDLSTASSIGLKRLRPIAPSPVASHDLKEPIDHACQRVGYSTLFKPTALQCGGTRWNPTDEQIRMLESLYGRGVRTPNAKDIEEIAAELRRYGRIEGKNVFYWFQNHKARERQKRKRSAAAAVADLPPRSTSTSFSPPRTHHSMCGEAGSSESEEGRLNRRRNWGVVSERKTPSAGRGDLTLLELFPLHPERESTSIRS